MSDGRSLARPLMEWTGAEGKVAVPYVASVPRTSLGLHLSIAPSIHPGSCACRLNHQQRPADKTNMEPLLLPMPTNFALPPKLFRSLSTKKDDEDAKTHVSGRTGGERWSLSPISLFSRQLHRARRPREGRPSLASPSSLPPHVLPPATS